MDHDQGRLPSSRNHSDGNDGLAAASRSHADAGILCQDFLDRFDLKIPKRTEEGKINGLQEATAINHMIGN